MKKRIGAILLTLCMLVGLLPTAVFAVETTGPTVTLEYPEDLCTITVTDRNNSSATVENGGNLTLGSNGRAAAIFEIENIAEGYRIAKVMMDDRDYTVNFITGAYGGMARGSITEDVTLSVTLEEIPVLPVLEFFEVYADENYTQVLSTDLTLTEATEIYVKGIYADGGEYPEYTARGHMEYTLDGITWQWTQWGGDYWYFPLNDTFYSDFDPLADSYDFRICIEPDNLYCTGDILYSETYHVNGGVDGTAGGSGGESGQYKLAAPTNLNWHRFYDYNSNDGSYVDFKSLISWQITDTEYDQTSHVVVYKDGEEVFTNGWTYRAARGEVYQSDWDFSLSDYGSGTYQFTVQACGDGETTEDSVVATSDPWMFTAASTKLAAPEIAWSSDEPLTARWTSSTENLAGGYQIRMYYSPDNANATSTADLDVVSRFVYYTALDGEQISFGYDPESEDGYYYFQVRAISSDESQVRHSAWSGLSTAYAHGVSSGGDGDTGSGGSSETTTPMHRLYNPNSGEHFYTGSVEERNVLTAAGWAYEGIAWNAPTNSGSPVYRLFNPNNSDHHYTMSAEEKDMLVGVGWIYEGVCWNSAPADQPGSMGLYRLFNPNADCGSHHYTGSEEEKNMLVSAGWIYEGIGWFGMLE